MKLHNPSFRVRIALVLVGVGAMCALLMSATAYRIMRNQLEKLALNWAKDVAVALVEVLERDGITVEKLEKNPGSIAQLKVDLAHANKDLAANSIMWGNIIIAVPEGDQWRVIARQDPEGAIYLDGNDVTNQDVAWGRNTYSAVGSLIRADPVDEDTLPLSPNRRSAGWYKGVHTTMFGAVEPFDGNKGILCIGARKEIVEAGFRDILQIILIGFSAVAVFCVLISWPISKKLVQPFREIGRFGAALDEGRFDHRLVPRGAPEVRQVFGELNRFARNLQERDNILRQNRQLQGKLELQEARIQAIGELELDFNQLSDFDLFMGRVLETVPKVVHAKLCAVFLAEDDEFVLSYARRASVEPSESLSIIGHTASQTGILAIAMEKTTAVVEKLTCDHGSFIQDAQIVGAEAVAIAMKSGSGQTLGVILVARQPTAASTGFTEQELSDVRHVASLICMVLERRAVNETILWRMIRMAETRDPSETGSHVKRVSATAVEIFDGWVRRRGMRQEETQFSRNTLRLAAMLHDVGKVGISDVILKKPGKLTKEEYGQMKHHTVLGAALLPGNSSHDEAAREVALHHHERWDGGGYPGVASVEDFSGDIQRLLERKLPSAGMAGDKIPLFARIVAIADVFDALSSRRAYKDAWPADQVEQEMRKESGRAFDPELLGIFFERIGRIRSARARYPDLSNPKTKPSILVPG